MELLEILYQLGELGNGILVWISAAGSLVSIISAVISKKHDEKKPVIIWIALAVVFILVALVTFVGHNLVETPDVVGYLYEDARHVLVESNLKYSVLVDNGIYVEAQEPEAGTIVAPGTTIKLTVGQTSSTEEAIAYFESEINATDFGSLEVQFYEAQVQIMDGANIIRCFGPDFYDITVAEAYLLQEDYGVKYCDYSINDGMLVFNDIPTGIDFTLYILLDGYEEARCKDIMLSSINMVDDTFHLNLGLTKDGCEYMPATSFRVADESGQFLSGVKLEVKFPWKDIWYGDYPSTEDGSFPYVFWLDQNQTVEVCMIDPLGNGQDYYCTVTLRKYQSGDIADDSVIIISENGTCTVVDESTYFGY